MRAVFSQAVFLLSDQAIRVGRPGFILHTSDSGGKILVAAQCCKLHEHSSKQPLGSLDAAVSVGLLFKNIEEQLNCTPEAGVSASDGSIMQFKMKTT